MDKEFSWPLEAIVYHIYVRSFKDTNNDGIGDLAGLIEKIDYLHTSLCVNALWLSPIYSSPQKDFGYDIADYTNIDPMYGSLNDFDQLVHILHKRDIKILMDYVPNHTSSKHTWFLESRSSKNNPKRNWYVWKDPKPDGSPPNNWLSFFGGSAWKLDEKTNQYYLHSFDVDQPDLNWRNPDVVKAMHQVLRFWLNRGVDGFRVDAVYCLFKDEDFRDEPINPTYVVGAHDPYEMLYHPYTFALPETIDMIKQFADILKEYKNKFMVTEAYLPVKELIKLYTTVSWKWFVPFNFSLLTVPWKAEDHKIFIDEFDATIGEVYIPSYVSGNHDRSRMVTRVGQKQARIAAMLMLTLRGMPFIYYGDEIGMKDSDIPKEYIQDPFEKNVPGLKLGRDPQRTPMQWDNSFHAGFTKGNPWLPVNREYKMYNVKREEKDPHSMLSLYKKLIILRKKYNALRFGTYVPLPHPTQNVLAFMRNYKDKEKLLILLNFSPEVKKISLDIQKARVVAHSSLIAQEGTVINLKNLTLQPDEGYIFSLDV